MSGNKNSGRKAKEGSVRTSVLIDAEIYNYLSRDGNISAEVERITREDMGNPEMKTITITHRSKLGWSWTCWTPERPEPPTKPEIVGTYNKIMREIDTDANYRSLVSGGTYLSTAWFVRVNGAWRRIVEAPGDLAIFETAAVTIE